MASKVKVVLFRYAPDDEYATEHAAILKWAADAALKSRGQSEEPNLKSTPSGEVFLKANAEQSCRFVTAAVTQVRFWDRQALELRRQAQDKRSGSYDDKLPEWYHVRALRVQTMTIIQSLLRRKLPLDKNDLLSLLAWTSDAESLSHYHAPIAFIVRALELYAANKKIDDELRSAMHHFARQARSSYDNSTKRLGTVVEQLCLKGQAQPDSDAPVLSTPEPAPAGDPSILADVKTALRMLPDQAPLQTTVLAPDGFDCLVESPLLEEHAVLSDLLHEIIASGQYNPPNLLSLECGRKVLDRPARAMGRLLLAAAERHGSALLSPMYDANQPQRWESRHALGPLTQAFLNSEFETDRAGTFDLLLYVARLFNFHRLAKSGPIARLIAFAEKEAKQTPLTEGERFVLSLVRNALVTGPALGGLAEDVARISRLVNDGALFYLAPGEVWSDQINQDVRHGSAKSRSQWLNVLRLALTATSPRPSAKWLKTARPLIESLGEERLSQSLNNWLPLVAKGRSVGQAPTCAGDTRALNDLIHPENADCLRGLLWCVPLLTNRNTLLRPVTTVALSAFKKVPGVGPRAPKVGNACVYVLSQLGTKEAVGQLAMLKVRIKSGSAQKEIKKAFDAAAIALGLPCEEIEELGVPSYGLEEVGRLVETLDRYQAELIVTGIDAELRWSDANGKSLKSVPAKVKSEHKEELRNLQQSLKDVKSMLPAQRDRIDGMLLLQKSWPIAEWRERYHDHPLVGTIAQRLIWCVDGTPALYSNGIPTDVEGAAIVHGHTAEIALWHPIGRSIEEITAWRNRLEELAIMQPFKQAYREVYLLTDAERTTRTYSNRFAAHVIRQHQLNALCAARGWKNKLRLMVDAAYPPATKELPQWGLRAEFWIDGIGQDYGIDTNDSGTYLRLATDQVRFYRTSAAANHTQVGAARYTSDARAAGVDNVNEPIPLEHVPPLVFSEIMRDVDLFVGVGSVGNDPTWQDGGPDGRYREYWQNYSFGDLSGTATTRKQVLQRLIPRLTIASRCSFNDRFLVVRGDKRTYKIHLGSGNILMEPNDQYLCIVPDAKARGEQNGLYLPFDGDAMLSVIISKALLLAADTKIKDPTINGQIEQR